MNYQYNYAEGDPILYDIKGREQKAKKIIAVLSEFYDNNLKHLTFLDVGSSTGIMTHLLSNCFFNSIGIDIDNKAVAYAQEHFQNDRLQFQIGDSMNLPFQENTFDVVNCTQVYEHVPDSKILMSEIYRVLKPGGVCFF